MAPQASARKTRERQTGPKCIALIGPLAGGKTTLFNSILHRSNHGHGYEQSPQATEYSMSIEAAFATIDFMGEKITWVDCPGSVEFSADATPVLMAADAAVIVIDAEDPKLPMLQIAIKQLEKIGIPHIIFLNKMDKCQSSIRDMLKTLQSASSIPLLLRQIPLRRNGIVIGSIDLTLERAYIYREAAESQIALIPDEEKARELEARFSMLEVLADNDDALMEQLLDEIDPPNDDIFDGLTHDLMRGAIVPVLIGTAERSNGVLRLLKTVRHDVANVFAVQNRLKLQDRSIPVVQVMKTIHAGHSGKVSIGRVLSGSLTDGVELGSSGRVSGIYQPNGKELIKTTVAEEGDTVALGKLDNACTGQTLTASRSEQAQLAPLQPPFPLYSLIITPSERKNEAKLSATLQKLQEEDPSLSLSQTERGETLVGAQGEMHLRTTLKKLEMKYQLATEACKPAISYRETICKSVTQRGRYKKQSGGHGQFGDVVLDIKPLERGGGFIFTDTITAGVVPKQYIPSVESGVKDALNAGPLGFPVVDIAINLADGSYHSVDSSDMAFQLAARLAMREGQAQAHPILLEPVLKIEVTAPNDATARVIAILSQRRGQILGFSPRQDWEGWDKIEALIPEAETGNIIIELRSVTAGAANYITSFSHMAEVSAKQTEDILSKTKHTS